MFDVSKPKNVTLLPVSLIASSIVKFKYVNPKYVDRLVGKYAPVSSFVLSLIIEETLQNANLGYVHTEATVGRFKSDIPEITKSLIGIADKLLANNLSRSRKNAWDFYGGLDFDFVHESNPNAMRNGKHTNTSVKAYFYYKEFARPKTERRVVFHLNHHEIDGTMWSISFPIQVVMKGFQFIEDGCIGYCHGISLLGDEASSFGQRNYCGVTKRDWLKRMGEHFRAIRNGSNKLFHSAWRQFVGRSDVHLISELIVVNHTFEEIMAWEEWVVDREMAAGTSLNMIPGGFKGMKFLHEHRLTLSERVSLEERDAGTLQYQAANSRAGIPNLLISELWNDQAYAESVICGAEGRLSVDQVRRIRQLNDSGVSIEKIVEATSAKNKLQVERVLSGLTYSRVR
ncbi:hypothetical protein ACLH0M_14745 [Aeromonas media]